MPTLFLLSVTDHIRYWQVLIGTKKQALQSRRHQILGVHPTDRFLRTFGGPKTDQEITASQLLPDNSGFARTA
ncbi:hypothetical protein MRBLRH8O_004528 [Agrobacterium radiobacter]|uniref:hypothetical protein n=1 Tax=Agrobacterium TaxID=357 RepID=UPI000D1DDDC3|nr:hypothetical protein [Agrobacterium sp. LAD9]